MAELSPCGQLRTSAGQVCGQQGNGGRTRRTKGLRPVRSVRPSASVLPVRRGYRARPSAGLQGPIEWGRVADCLIFDQRGKIAIDRQDVGFTYAFRIDQPARIDRLTGRLTGGPHLARSANLCRKPTRRYYAPVRQLRRPAAPHNADLNCPRRNTPMPNLIHSPGTLAGDDRGRPRRILQPGESITFEGAFRDAQGRLLGPAAPPDPKAAMALARRRWCDRKANQHRMPEAASPAADPRTALADARAAKLTRIGNAYRNGSR
jgi:hypothetical protein